MGLAEKGFSNGYVFFIICLMSSVQAIFCGQFIAPKINRFKNAMTINQIMGKLYGQKASFISSLISVFYCIAIVGVVAKASGVLINQVFGIDENIGIILSTVIVISYSTAKGLQAVVLSDVIQFIVLVICIPMTVLFALDNQENLVSLNDLHIGFNDSGLPVIEIIALSLSFLLGEALIPPYVTRALMASNSNTARRGFILAGFFSVFWFFIVISIGILAKLIDPGSDPNLAFYTVLEESAPVGIMGLIVAAIIAIIMSTKDSFLNTGASILILDIVCISSETKALSLIKAFTVLIGSLAIVFAITIPNLIDAIVIAFTIWAPTVVLPLIIGLLKKNVKARSGLLAILAGLVTTLISEYAFDGYILGLPSVIMGVFINQIFFWTFELIKINK